MKFGIEREEMIMNGLLLRLRVWYSEFRLLSYLCTFFYFNKIKNSIIEIHYCCQQKRFILLLLICDIGFLHYFCVYHVFFGLFLILLNILILVKAPVTQSDVERIESFSFFLSLKYSVIVISIHPLYLLFTKFSYTRLFYQVHVPNELYLSNFSLPFSF